MLRCQRTIAVGQAAEGRRGIAKRLCAYKPIERRRCVLVAAWREGSGADGRCDQDARALSGGRIVDLEIECHPAAALRDWETLPLPECSFYHFVKKVYPKTVLAIRRFWKNRTCCFSHRQTFFEFSSHDQR